MSRSAQVRLVEHAYELERGLEEWMALFGGVLHELVPGAVTSYVMEFSRVDGQIVVGELWTDGPDLERQFRLVLDALPAQFRELFVGAPLKVGTPREILGGAGVPVESTPISSLYERLDVSELLSVSAIDPSGRGMTFGVGLRGDLRPSPELRTTLSQIGAHVAAGTRLRRRLRGEPPTEHAEAILRPDGELEHARQVDRGASELLAEAVRSVEWARQRGRDPREALDLWQALVAGRWSLVDHFEGGGRRYYVAVPNAPTTARSKALTPREAEVVAYIASGTGTKSTAYALGIDPKTVSTHLRSALTKLGLHSRAELISLRAMLLGDASTPAHSSTS
jgi:DNA-binding CsgD family transcriptional regulator